MILHSGFTPGGIQGTTCDAKDQTQIVSTQGNHCMRCTLSPAFDFFVGGGKEGKLSVLLEGPRVVPRDTWLSCVGLMVQCLGHGI